MYEIFILVIHILIVLSEIPIKHVLTYKFLVVYIDEKLDWKQQYRYVTSKLCRVIGIIKKLNNNLNLNTRILIINHYSCLI